MKVIYWNTLVSSPGRLVFNNLEALDRELDGVDYFCLCEANDELVGILEKKGWHNFYIKNTDGRGLLITSKKHQLINPRSYLVSEVKRFGETIENHLLLVDVEVEDEIVTLALTHLTYLRMIELKKRWLERKYFQKIIPTFKTILGGDFNTVIIPFSKYYIMEVGYVSKIKGKTWRWLTKNRLYEIPVKLQLDYIFVTYDLNHRVEARILPGREISDHFPTLAVYK